jgi:hypothetical protein
MNPRTTKIVSPVSTFTLIFALSGLTPAFGAAEPLPCNGPLTAAAAFLADVAAPAVMKVALGRRGHPICPEH